MKRRMFYALMVAGMALAGTTVWAMTARENYESAEYKVVESDGAIEIRDYPDLMLASTDAAMDTQGRDGSFMRLFRYISGANKSDQQIAMTTPVFMEGELGKSDVSMGFVMPKDVVAAGVPDPKGEGVKIRTREGGRFAVIRFSGILDSKIAKKQEEKLREWMKTRNLNGQSKAEAAGYDAPFTPGPLRRNEILIRLIDEKSETPPPSEQPKN